MFHVMLSRCRLKPRNNPQEVSSFELLSFASPWAANSNYSGTVASPLLTFGDTFLLFPWSDCRGRVSCECGSRLITRELRMCSPLGCGMNRMLVLTLKSEPASRYLRVPRSSVKIPGTAKAQTL
jgi:hypothetical protein